MTPMLCTPSLAGMVGAKSEMTSAAQTPGVQSVYGGFSPALLVGDGNFCSPMMGSPSPYYGSPQYSGMQNRVGSGQYVSPIYGQSMSLNSGMVGYAQSPIYQHRPGGGAQ